MIGRWSRYKLQSLAQNIALATAAAAAEIFELFSLLKLLIIGWILYAAWAGLVSGDEWQAFRADPQGAMSAIMPLVVAATGMLMAFSGFQRRPSLEELCWMFMFGILLMSHTSGYGLSIFGLGLVLRGLAGLWCRWQQYRTTGYWPL